VFTALDHCKEAIEITSEDHVIQVGGEKINCFVELGREKSQRDLYSVVFILFQYFSFVAH